MTVIIIIMKLFWLFQQKIVIKFNWINLMQIKEHNSIYLERQFFNYFMK